MTAPEIGYAFSPGHAMKLATAVPDMGQGPLGTESVTSPEYFERERERIFRRAWLEVGRVEEIPNPGDYFTRELAVLRTNVVVVRGRDGTVRAFHNFCTHRGMALATAACGHTRTFACEFHGWAFGLDGRLQHVPCREAFDTLDTERLGLRALGCEVWNGFIFVHADAHPAQNLRDYLGALADDLDGYPFAACEHIAHYTATVKANWKVCIDAFQEAYHATYLHRRAIPGAGDLELALPTSIRFHGPHRSLSCWLKTDIQPTAAEAVALKFCDVGFVKAQVEQAPGMNPSRDASVWFDINVVFPNFFCDVARGWYFTYNFWPLSVNETVWNMNIYQLPARTAGERIVQEFTRIVLRDTVYEDMSTMEFSQKAFDSGVITHQQLSGLEIAMRHQYHVVDEWVRS